MPQRSYLERSVAAGVSKAAMGNPPGTANRLYKILKNFDQAMLLSHAADGNLHARPMVIAELAPDAEATFITSVQAPKVSELEADPRVTLTFQSSSQFAAISGTARLVRDQALIDRLWSEAWRVWFPEGKDDPNLCLIRIDAHHGEYWDSAGAQGIKYAFEAAMAYVKGERPVMDDKQHGKVKL